MPVENVIKDELSKGLPRVAMAGWEPEYGTLLVDMGAKPGTMPKSDKNELTNFLHSMGKKYHDRIPLGEIFVRLQRHGIVPLQEDGSVWSGLLMGEKECGSPEAKDQRAIFQLAMRMGDGSWRLLKETLTMTWCVVAWNPSPKYEVVAYVW